MTQQATMAALYMFRLICLERRDLNMLAFHWLYKSHFFLRAKLGISSMVDKSACVRQVK